MYRHYLPATQMESLIGDHGVYLIAGVLVASVFLIRIFWKAMYRLLFHPLAKVPGPFLAKIFPQYLSPAVIAGNKAQFLLSLHQKYGPAVRVGPDEVSIGDWNCYREIYSQKGSIKDDLFYASGSFLGVANIFSMSDKAQHSARRKMQNYSYSLQAIMDLESLVAEKSNALVRKIAAGAQASPLREVNIFELVGLFSFEVICKCTFDKDFSENSDESGVRLLKAMDASAKLFPLDTVFPFLKAWGIGRKVPGPIGDLYRAFDYWELETREMVEEFQQKIKPQFMLSPLIESTDYFLNRKLNQTEIVEESMGIMFAGSGTTSTTLTYLIYALSRPEARLHQERLRDELRQAPNDYQTVKDLPFMNAVIKETMRLYPTIISTLPRVLNIDLRVGELIIPEGTRVGMQNYVHHRDPTLFPEPDQFVPERWLQASKDMETALTPFSVGPRNCIGQNLARAELYHSVNMIFRQLKLSLGQDMTERDMDMEDRFNIAPRSRKLILKVEFLT